MSSFFRRIRFLFFQIQGSKNPTTEATKEMENFLKNAPPLQTNKQGWNQMYANNVTPWNLKQAAPPLRYLLDPKYDTSKSPDNKEIEIFKSKKFERCLVPGCGEGFDVAYLSSRPGTKEAVGLEISELALKECEKIKNSSSNFLNKDFFEYQDSLLFDLIFDYTFFCAIHPELRKQWAEKMKELVKPGGILITLIFPIGDFEGGPPYAVSEKSYYDLLLGKGFKIIFGPTVVDASVEQRKGREKLAVWERTFG